MKLKRAPINPIRQQTTGDLCVPNIGGRQLMIRRVSGIVSFAAALGLFGSLMYYGAHPAWHLTVFLPAVSGFFGWLQAQEKT